MKELSRKKMVLVEIALYVIIAGIILFLIAQI